MKLIHNLFEEKVAARTMVVVSLLLSAAILAIYGQVAGSEFVNLDDYAYVVSNPFVAHGFTRAGIVWAFTSSTAANWHPLTWLSHMMDVQLYGMNPHGHHVTNVLIHIAASLLLLRLLYRLTGSFFPSLLVAALFAVHPLHVESVAWVSERKDVLSAFFCFLTIIWYVDFVAKRKWQLYLAALFCYLMGLMSKPMLVSLPLVLLLIDYWPLGRFEKVTGQADEARTKVVAAVLEKIPFFVLSLLCCIITFLVQEKGGATRSFGEISPLMRLENVLVAYVKYVLKTLWPQDLSAMYPFPASIPPWQPALAAAALLAVSTAAFVLRKRSPYLMMGWLWFLITLIPVIGLVQVGEQSMADRYTYIPGIGLSIITAWGLMELTRTLRNRETILALSALAVFALLTALSWKQTGYWRTSFTLFRHADRVTPNSAVIHKYLGDTLLLSDNLDGAISEFKEALRLKPQYAEVHNLLGDALGAKQDYQGAMSHLQEALRENPRVPDAHFNLGEVLMAQGRLEEAIRHFYLHLKREPDDAVAHNALGIALGRTGSAHEAAFEFEEALRIDPDFAEARNNLAMARGGK